MLNHLKLDSFDVEISFSESKKEIIHSFREQNISIDTPTDVQIVVQSNMFSLDVNFLISFYFDGEKLIAIIMSPDTVLNGRALYSRYNKIQKALENQLGHPRNHLRLIMDLIDPDSRLAYWQSNGMKIEHYLVNRFGMEDIIHIELSSK